MFGVLGVYNFAFCSKINEYEQKKSEKNEKTPDSQNMHAKTLTSKSPSISNISHGKSK